MNTKLNNVIVENQKVYAENEEATHTNIKTLDDTGVVVIRKTIA